RLHCRADGAPRASDGSRGSHYRGWDGHRGGKDGGTDCLWRQGREESCRHGTCCPRGDRFLATSCFAASGGRKPRDILQTGVLPRRRAAGKSSIVLRCKGLRMLPTDVAVRDQQAPSGKQRVVNDFSIQVATVNGSGSQTANLVLLRSILLMGVPVSGKNM